MNLAKAFHHWSVLGSSQLVLACSMTPRTSAMGSQSTLPAESSSTCARGAGTAPIKTAEIPSAAEAEETGHSDAFIAAPCPPDMEWHPGGTLRVAEPTFTFDPSTGETHRYPARFDSTGPFCLDRVEVDREHLLGCTSTSECTPPSVWGRSLKKPAFVSYAAAKRHCALLGRRLPSMTEFDFAAGKLYRWRYPWGNSVPPDDGICWNRNARSGPCDVGTSSADVNPQGVRDLLGNVSEWILNATPPQAYRAPPRWIMGGNYTTPGVADAGVVMDENASPRAGVRCARAPRRRDGAEAAPEPTDLAELCSNGLGGAKGSIRRPA